MTVPFFLLCVRWGVSTVETLARKKKEMEVDQWRMKKRR